MTDLDQKLLDNFPGKIVRKDLTSLMKKGANIPTYVMEYLLGMYCATDDEEIIQKGISKIKKILSENYVKSEQTEYIKSKIRENGEYTIIDKISVSLDEYQDVYVAEFMNLKIPSFQISSDLVVNNEKLLIDGIWCVIKIEYISRDNEENVLFFDDEEEYSDNSNSNYFTQKLDKKSSKKKKSKKQGPFYINTIKPIQMPSLNLNQIFESRINFSKDEWVDVLLKSAGFNPTVFSPKQKFHILLRFVPLIQRNYNLVELGPRGTGKSHTYSELSPYSILMSSGNTTVANMFYNMKTNKIGLVGNWDVVAFDEVGGITQTSGELVQILKNYMANGLFARGNSQINSEASVVFDGNTFKSVSEMIRTTNLFDPFPEEFNNDSAFFDRIHAYLPGWETPKLRSNMFTNEYGLISDCLSELCHLMRKYDCTDKFNNYFSLNSCFNTRDEIAVRRTFSGLYKLIYLNGDISKEEAEELLIYSIECRRRVKEQLRKMNPTEFSDVCLGYIDNETGTEYIVDLPEVSGRNLVFEGIEKPGYVYALGTSNTSKIGIYRLENKVIDGTGKLNFNNVEGLADSQVSSKASTKDSIKAAFNYFKTNATKLVSSNPDIYDYTLFYNDMQNRGVSDEISVAETVALFSALSNRPVLSALIIVGRVVMSGSLMDMNIEINDIISAASNAGAKRVMLPDEYKTKNNELNIDLQNDIEIIYYSTPLDAARKALGV